MLFSLSFAAVVHTTESKTGESGHVFQLECMRKLFRLDALENFTPEEMHAIDGGWGPHVCDWPTVRACRSGTVTDIFLPDLLLPHRLDLSWLPSELKSFYVLSTRIKTTLETRKLPRSLLDANFLNCELFGSLELRTLPPDLQSFRCCRNNLSGTVYIVNLPKTIRRILLSRNKITKAVVLNESLPKTLQEIQIFRNGKKVSLRAIDGKNVDSRIHTNRYAISEYEGSTIDSDYTSTEWDNSGSRDHSEYDAYDV